MLTSEDCTNAWMIDYQSLVDVLHGLDYEGIVGAIVPVLEAQWCDLYRQMTPAQNCVDIIVWDTFNYAYDNPGAIIHHDFVWNQDVEDRTVVVYGRSRPVQEKRDSYRMRGPRGEREWGEGRDHFHYDRGYYIAHSMGGHADLGLFPQRRDINRGRSPRGRVFRSMERYCYENPSVFCFSRPIYLDKSSHPFYLEYGVLRDDLKFWVELFENRYTDQLFTAPPEQ